MNGKLKELESAVAEERTIQNLRKIHHIFHSIMFGNCISFEVETIETLFEKLLDIQWSGRIVSDTIPFRSPVGKNSQRIIVGAFNFIEELGVDLPIEDKRHIGRMANQHIYSICSDCHGDGNV